ncbi:MAG: HlyD family efflux transporter periplasmic adaptor subunit [Verrucomicrobiota bacterium]|nr:HlyD family efflux transporter periplasmic adaptor subunit [Verrucomicrobiota bacterium]
MRTRLLLLLSLIPLAIGQAGCRQAREDRLQGYVEAEFIHVSSPIAGELKALPLLRGMEVKKGALLFSLETTSELIAREEALRRLEEGRARLADAKKGLRSSEIRALEARLNQARASLDFSEKDLARLTGLTQARAASVQDLDRARTARDEDANRVAQLEAELETARSGSRADLIAAAEANVKALEAACALAEWNLARKEPKAVEEGLVFDTLYEPGEWVPAGRPVLSLLPPANIKVRAFVPEKQIASVKLGQTVRVTVDGLPQPLEGKVSFISPQAEYTPPVIYSQDSREKLVFMIEVRFEPDLAQKLHPGQPIDLQL